MFQSWINGFVVASNLSRYLGRKLVNMFLLGFVFSYKEFQIMINPPRILAEVNRSRKKNIFKLFATFDLTSRIRLSAAWPAGESPSCPAAEWGPVRSRRLFQWQTSWTTSAWTEPRSCPVSWVGQKHNMIALCFINLEHTKRPKPFTKNFILASLIQDPLMEYWGRVGKKWGSKDSRK